MNDITFYSFPDGVTYITYFSKEKPMNEIVNERRWKNV